MSQSPRRHGLIFCFCLCLTHIMARWVFRPLSKLLSLAVWLHSFWREKCTTFCSLRGFYFLEVKQQRLVNRPRNSSRSAGRRRLNPLFSAACWKMSLSWTFHMFGEWLDEKGVEPTLGWRRGHKAFVTGWSPELLADWSWRKRKE